MAALETPAVTWRDRARALLPDLRDLHVYVGLGIAAAGGWQLSPPITLIALGLSLAAIGLFYPALLLYLGQRK